MGLDWFVKYVDDIEGDYDCEYGGRTYFRGKAIATLLYAYVEERAGVCYGEEERECKFEIIDDEIREILDLIEEVRPQLKLLPDDHYWSEDDVEEQRECLDEAKEFLEEILEHNTNYPDSLVQLYTWY